PIQCGEKLWICPSWKEPADPTATNILLDPGLAFGTGTHPTTWLCLQWLSQQNLEGLTVVDYGCGSGILGIAALLLGADKVYAVDIDPQALSATRDNAQRNGISDEKIECMFPDAFPASLQADMVLANILAGPLVELAPRIAGAAKPGAPLCLSGVLERQAPELQQCYKQWFSNIELASKEEWVRITGDKHSG
ncbi:MAG: 50S ribosomal protein L11 methyltransferase, partial [Spongiibacteraceae bacterium]